MRTVVLRAPQTFEQAFAQIRSELDVPLAFPTEVLNEAEASRPDPGHRRDARNLPLVAIDPPGATDLDQAFAASPTADGFRVWYAIADVGAFIVPGGSIDIEARRRGTTLYCPDFRAPLHPAVLSEDRASLLPGGDRPALLWTIDLDERGQATQWRIERATVRVREAISYLQAQSRIDGQAPGHDNGRADDDRTGVDRSLRLLAIIGPLRQHREAERGGVSLNLPAQEIAEEEGHYVLTFDRPLPVEGWNAQLSLLAGMAAGKSMVDAGVGLLRTLPPAQPADVAQLRRVAAGLDLHWPASESYADYVRGLQPTTPAHNAFLLQCTRLFKGAGYVGFNGSRPPVARHGAIGAVYSHVTAPLRRLVDRFGNEILLATFADQAPPAWALEALDELPAIMGQARQRESTLERALLDMAEALILEHHVGQTFDATVVDLDRSRGQATVQVTKPAVVTTLNLDDDATSANPRIALGQTVKLRLTGVDVAARRVDFAVDR